MSNNIPGKGTQLELHNAEVVEIGFNDDEQNTLISRGGNWQLRCSETKELKWVAPHYTCQCTEKQWAYQNIFKPCEVQKALYESLFLIKNKFPITHKFDRIHMTREGIPTNL